MYFMNISRIFQKFHGKNNGKEHKNKDFKFNSVKISVINFKTQQKNSKELLNNLKTYFWT